MSFEELNLAPQILQALTACGYNEPTPIQAQTIPALLDGPRPDRLGADRHRQDGRVRAAGAAAARRVRRTRRRGPHTASRVPRVLVLAPTRELAQQVAEQAVRYGRGLRVQHRLHLRRRAVPGAEPRARARRRHLVATPGRLIDHLERGRIDLSQLRGAGARRGRPDARHGLRRRRRAHRALTPKTRQTVLFSATFDGAIARLAAR